jgi:hypothetical protein
MFRGRPDFHSNRCQSKRVANNCAGVVRHEEWSIMKNERVFYAYEVVVDPGKLDFAVRLIPPRARRELGLFRASPIASLFSLKESATSHTPAAEVKLSSPCNRSATP